MALPLVVDWDGTVTEVDGLHLVLLEFGGEGIYDSAEARLGRELTLNEVIALRVQECSGSTRGGRLPWVRANVRVRDGFGAFARNRLLLIVSSGFHELIDPVLEREGLELEVVANRLDPRPDGWRAVFRSAEPCPVCGEPCKRADVGGLDAFVYVGDGVSDRCVARGRDPRVRPRRARRVSRHPRCPLRVVHRLRRPRRDPGGGTRVSERSALGERCGHVAHDAQNRVNANFRGSATSQPLSPDGGRAMHEVRLFTRTW